MSRRRSPLYPHSHSTVTSETPIVDLPPIWGNLPPASISTVAFGKSAGEVFLTIATAQRVFPDVPILVYCEQGLFDRFCKTGLPTRGLRFLPLITPYELERRAQRLTRFASDGMWVPAALTFKMDAIRAAVARFGATLFVDSDVLFLQPFGVPRQTALLGLSPHYSGDASFERKVGQVNAGFLYVSQLPTFANWWRNAFIGRSTFFEQQCLESAHAFFETTIFGVDQNVGIWADPTRWDSAKTLHVHLYGPRRKENTVFHPERAEKLANYAEGRLQDSGFASLIEGVNNGNF